MTKKWIVVANRVQARIFRVHPFKLIDRLTNELGREKNRAFTRGRPGLARGRLSTAASTHSLTGEKSPHKDMAVAFARRLDRFLKHGLGLGHFEQVLIMAEPRMLGRIRNNLSSNVSRHCEWVGKDFNHMSTQEIARYLRR